jgi:hypothetical protein
MKELESAIVAAFTKMAETGAIQAIIEKKIEKTVDEILGDALRSYSDFGKNLSEVIKGAMNVDLRQLGLVGYNDIVLKIVKAKLDHSMEVFGKAQIEKYLEELLKCPPAEIKLSELVEQLKEAHSDDERYECTCIVEWGKSDGWGRVYLDKNGDKRKYDCEHSLSFTKEGEIYSFSIEGRDPSKKIFCGPFYGFERTLFQMYAAKTRLIVDEDDVEIHYPGSED